MSNNDRNVSNNNIERENTSTDDDDNNHTLWEDTFSNRRISRVPSRSLRTSDAMIVAQPAPSPTTYASALQHHASPNPLELQLQEQKYDSDEEKKPAARQGHDAPADDTDPSGSSMIDAHHPVYHSPVMESSRASTSSLPANDTIFRSGDDFQLHHAPFLDYHFEERYHVSYDLSYYHHMSLQGSASVPSYPPPPAALPSYPPPRAATLPSYPPPTQMLHSSYQPPSSVASLVHIHGPRQALMYPSDQPISFRFGDTSYTQPAVPFASRESPRQDPVSTTFPRASHEKRFRLPTPSGEELEAAQNKRARDALYTWYERLGELYMYKEEHGDCNVPQQYDKNRKLGIWVNKQRMEKKAWDNRNDENAIPTSLTENKLAELEKVGFAWAKPKGEESWYGKYNELLEYHHRNGHCNVPTKYTPNPALGRWVSTQRSQYKDLLRGRPTKITQKRIELLNMLHFTWDMVSKTEEHDPEQNDYNER